MIIWAIAGQSDIRLHISPHTSPQELGKRQEAARIAVRRLLACALGKKGTYPYQHTSTGAPYLAGEGMPYLSISHTEGYVAIALSIKRPIGIDIERISNQVERVTPRFITEDESSLLETLPPREYRLALHILWSAKEAAYKLSNPPSRSLLDFELLGESDTLCKATEGELLLSCCAKTAPSQEPSARSICIHYTYSADYVVTLAYWQESQLEHS